MVFASSAFSAVDTTSVAAGVGGEIAFHGKYNTGAQDYAYLGHIRGLKKMQLLVILPVH